MPPMPSPTSVLAALHAANGQRAPMPAPQNVTQVALADENGTFGAPVLVNDAIKLIASL